MEYPPDSDSLSTWVFVSNLNYWVVLAIVSISIPLLLIGLYRLRILKRSHYYHFLMGICVAHITALSTILCELISQKYLHELKGPFVCKMSTFLTCAAACFANWTFVMMFVQRFVILLFPLKQMMEKGMMGFIFDARRLIFFVAVFSILSQSWSFMIMTEIVYVDENNVTHIYCANDPSLFDYAKGISILEMLSTYLLPFMSTLSVDLGVLIWSQHGPGRFTEAVPSRTSVALGRATSHVVLFRGLSGAPLKNGQDHDGGVKIQSAESVRTCNKRREKAIRRCLIMATVQVLINLPYHTIHVFDEFYNFTSNTQLYSIYLWGDAILYLVYLIQFPIVLFHIEFLISDTLIQKRKRSLGTNSRNHSYRTIGSRTCQESTDTKMDSLI